MDGSCSDDSEFEEEQAGGGPGPIRRRAGAGGPGADPGRRRLSGMLTDGGCECTLHVHAYVPLRPRGSGIDSF